MSISSFFERRRVPASIEFKDRRVVQRRTQVIAFSPERRRLASQGRRYDREALRIPVRLQIQEKNVSGFTRDIARGGLLVQSDTALRVGTPLALQFFFGDVCTLNVSGQVNCCLSSGTSGKHAIGIRFSAIREWEQKILLSAVQELKQSATHQERSLLKILVCKDTFALEAAGLRVGESVAKPDSDEKSYITRADLIPKQKGIDYTVDAARARREWLSLKTDVNFKHIGVFAEDPQIMRGRIENLIGVAHIPIGIAGPLTVNGQFAKGKFYVPMATTEGSLTYTCHQGMLLVSLSGGATTRVLKDELHISPVFSFESVKIAQQFTQWLEGNFETIKEAAEKTTRHAKLLRLEPHIFDRHVAVRFFYSTGDAMGINMITVATDKACKQIVSAVHPKKYYLQSNFASIKKVSAHNFITGFGKTVVAEVVIPGSLVKRFFNITAEEVVNYYQLVKLSITHAGMIGVNGHTANALGAVFIACGQDVACVVDSYIGVTNFEVTDDKALYVSVKLPSLLVGTVGGGTNLATQRECLSLLGCYGPGLSKKFSEVVAATVLAGEVAICASVANGTFANAHRKYGRKSWLKRLTPAEA